MKGITIPLNIQSNLGTNNEVSLAMFCAEFSFMDMPQRFWENELLNIKRMGLYAVVFTLGNGEDTNFAQLRIHIKQVHILCNLCSKVGVFCIIKINILNTLFETHVHIIQTAFHQQYYYNGGKLLGYICLKNVPYKNNGLDEQAFIWQVGQENHILCNVDSLHMHICQKQEFFSMFLNDVHKNLPQYSMFYVEDIKHLPYIFALQEFMHTCNAFCDCVFKKSLSIVQNDSLFCTLKSANKTNLLLIQSKADIEEQINLVFTNECQAILFSLTFTQTKNMYAILPVFIQYNQFCIEYASVQIVDRCIYKNKEIWVCKEIEGIIPQISLQGKVYPLSIMQKNEFTINEFKLEIYCVSKYERRNYRVLMYRAVPYIIFSNFEIKVLTKGFVLYSNALQKNITIFPNPEFTLPFLKKSFNSNFAAYQIQNRAQMLFADIEKEGGVYRIQIPAQVHSLYAIKQDVMVSTMYLEGYHLKIECAGNNILFLQKEVFPFHDIIEIVLNNAMIESNEIYVQSQTKPIAIFLEQIANSIQSETIYPFEVF